MCPAGQVRDIFSAAIFLIDGIPIGLQITLEGVQQLLGSNLSARGLVVKQHRPVQWGMVYPIVSLMGGAFLIAVQHFYRGLVNLEIAFCFRVEEELVAK